MEMRRVAEKTDCLVQNRSAQLLLRMFEIFSKEDGY